MNQAEILSYISKADDTEISEIIQAIIHRFDTLHPDDEIFFLSLPRNDLQVRQDTLDTLIRLLQESK